MRRGRPDDGLRPLFRQHLQRAQWTTVETGLVAQGVPDSEYCFPGGAQGWLECKATSGWAVRFRPEQIGWLDRRARLGGVAWIAVRRRCDAGPRRVAVDELYLIEARLVKYLSQSDLQRFTWSWPHSMWGGGPSQWDWGGVETLLTRR